MRGLRVGPLSWARALALAYGVSLAGCEAGPSAFDRSAAPGPEDTADVAALPEIPTAPDVEAARVAAPAEPSGPQSADAGPRDAVGESTPLRFEPPEHVRGLYLNAWAAGSSRRLDSLIALARRTEVNTFVIDIKDASGYVSHETSVPLAGKIGATEEIRIRDLPGLLRVLHGEGIYPIARIVIVKDPLLTAAYPDFGAQSRQGGVFVDRKGIEWLNLYDRRVWDYHIALAEEVAGMGFPEIQWDYVRFPDITAEEKEQVVYPGAEEAQPQDVIRAFLSYSREQLARRGALVTADVFGVVASARRDVGIGQVWESIIDQVDVALPMVYPSHYWVGSFGHRTPNAFPYEIVRRALEDAVKRSSAVEGAGATRPWLQDFSLGEPTYGPPEVRAQIQATYDAGIQEWILWNPGSRYTEGALEPTGGFQSEPVIRLANRLVPVSRRESVLDSVRASRSAPPTPDSASALPDSSHVRPDSSRAVQPARAPSISRSLRFRQSPPP